MKQEGGKLLMLAIRQVLAGQIYVSGKMSAKFWRFFPDGAPRRQLLLPNCFGP